MAAPARLSVVHCLRSLLAFALLLIASAAGATEVQLRDQLRIAPAPTGSVEANWTWLAVDNAGALDPMPADWRLLVDQVRFDEVGVVVVEEGGRTTKLFRTADRLQGNWAPGGLLAFDIRPPGRAIARLYLGFKAIDDVSLMRKVTAASHARASTLEARWLGLMGVFTGLLVSAFVYNLLVHAGQRHAFQRWYLGWVAVVLAYGLTWSNLAAYFVPGLAGPVAVRLDNVLISAAVALGSMFLISVLEAGTVPRVLRRAAQAAAGVCLVSGLVTADERIVAAAFGDRVLNYGMILSVLTSLV
ncbi:MAG TPA: diguanylate cyclase, partial [Croceibacterium sp.]|nr:diguanylate cyclase [Croceibacterium sp.]